MEHTKTIDIHSNILQLLDNNKSYENNKKVRDFINLNELEYSFCINNSMDVTIQISGKEQRNLFKKLNEMFPK